MQTWQDRQARTPRTRSSSTPTGSAGTPPRRCAPRTKTGHRSQEVQGEPGPLGQDRLCTWSEAAKHSRMFVCFVGLILSSYVRSVHKSNEYLSKKYGAVEDILAEMRSIRSIEHQGRLKFITPFDRMPSEVNSTGII